MEEHQQAKGKKREQAKGEVLQLRRRRTLLIRSQQGPEGVARGGQGREGGQAKGPRDGILLRNGVLMKVSL
jgi:hypothetical protein